MINNLGESVKINTISEEGNTGIFEVEGLYAGYGLTIGNALRRVLLSSLPGAAITQIKIADVGHEFSTIPHVIEDVVEIGLNFKKIRLRLLGDEPQTLVLRAKGEGKVTAANIEPNANVEVVTPETHLATLTTKGATLEVELTVERGLGYQPVEARKAEKLPIGVIALDAMFSPVMRVSFTVENMRVADRTDFNRLRLVIETDGSITPSSALQKTCVILSEHFAKIGGVAVKELPAPIAAEVKEKKTRAKKRKA